MSAQPPQQITLHQQSRVLEVVFADQHYQLPCEYLRVFSPSAEVRGHGNGPMQTVAGKRLVSISAVEPIGHYAVKLVFDDGHDSGLFSWETLQDLGRNMEANWQDYLHRLAAAGLSRDEITS